MMGAARPNDRAPRRASDSWPPRSIARRTFQEFQVLIRAESGISLSDAKTALLVGRLSRRLRQLQMDSFEQYLDFVKAPENGEERVVMVDCISTNETRFFREPEQFRFLEQTLVPGWVAQAAAGARPRRLRVWSAACSTGEEPYSLAMALYPTGQLDGWDVEIFASDISTRALARAKDARFGIERAAEIPGAYLRRYMLKGTGTQTGMMCAGPEICAMVRLARVNLAERDLPVGKGFDAIFCRNVMMYFDAPTKTAVVERLLDRLDPAGYLFLGHAETLTNVTRRARSVVPNVYQNVSTSIPRSDRAGRSGNGEKGGGACGRR